MGVGSMVVVGGVCPQCSLFFRGLRHPPGPSSHRGWLSALTLITVYLSDWPSHNRPGPLITEAEH